MCTAVILAFVAFPLCLCVYEQDFWRSTFLYCLRHWTDPLFPLKGIQGWSFNNTATALRTKAVHHIPESEERGPDGSDEDCVRQMCCQSLFFALDQLFLPR